MVRDADGGEKKKNQDLPTTYETGGIKQMSLIGEDVKCLSLIVGGANISLKKNSKTPFAF